MVVCSVYNFVKDMRLHILIVLSVVSVDEEIIHRQSIIQHAFVVKISPMKSKFDMAQLLLVFQVMKK